MLRLFDQVGEEAVPLPDNLALEESHRSATEVPLLTLRSCGAGSGTCGRWRGSEKS